MKNIQCEACGKVFNRHYAKDFSLIPPEVAALHGISDSKNFIICLECSRKLPVWYQKMVSTTTYDNDIKHFRDRTPGELIKEYQSAFTRFSNHYKRTHAQIALDLDL